MSSSDESAVRYTTLCLMEWLDVVSRDVKAGERSDAVGWGRRLSSMWHKGGAHGQVTHHRPASSLVIIHHELHCSPPYISLGSKTNVRGFIVAASVFLRREFHRRRSPCPCYSLGWLPSNTHLPVIIHKPPKQPLFRDSTA